MVIRSRLKGYRGKSRGRNNGEIAAISFTCPYPKYLKLAKKKKYFEKNTTTKIDGNCPKFTREETNKEDYGSVKVRLKYFVQFPH